MQQSKTISNAISLRFVILVRVYHIKFLWCLHTNQEVSRHQEPDGENVAVSTAFEIRIDAIDGIARSNTIKMLGVNIGSDLSVSQHIQRLVTSSAQAAYALRVLRTRGLDDAALQHVYCATVVARLMYAASTWRGLAKASDLRRINTVIDRA